MSAKEVNGIILKRRTTHFLFEWSIPDFFKLNPNKSIRSPEFSFFNCTFELRLSAYEADFVRNIRLFALKGDSWNCLIQNAIVTFGFKRTDGSVEELKSISRYFKDYHAAPPYVFLNSQELILSGMSLVSHDTLTITCRLEMDIPLERESQPLMLTDLETLSSDFKDLLINKKKCDVTVKVKHREFEVHRAVLMARSSVFSAMFEHGLSEEETGVVTVPDCDPDSFGDFLHYLYTGKMENVSLRKARHLYVTSDKYDVQGLKSFCVDYMMRNLAADNVCDVVTLAEQYDEAELLSATQTFFNEHFGIIVPTAEWEDMMKKNYRLANKLLNQMASMLNSKKILDSSLQVTGRKVCSPEIPPHFRRVYGETTEKRVKLSQAHKEL